MGGTIKKIGVLTSGGDAPGMNAAVRAVVRSAIYHGIGVKGIYRGYEGLLNEKIKDLSVRSVSNIIAVGGTCLMSARAPEFKEPKNLKKAADICRKHGIDSLVVIGGDGSFRGAKALSQEGIKCIGIPGTIDNDIASTEYSIGFDTAVNTVVQNVDRLRDTSQSHDRCSVVEVMGRHCGDIALHSAICTGAVSVLVPEVDFSVDEDVIVPMTRTLKAGKHHFIVILAEGVMLENVSDRSLNANMLAKYIEEKTGVVSRATVIGHSQRGGSPSPADRVLASQFGNHAVCLLLEGKSNRVVGIQRNRIVDFDIEQALEMKKSIDMDMYRISREISL